MKYFSDSKSEAIPTIAELFGLKAKPVARAKTVNPHGLQENATLARWMYQDICRHAIADGVMWERH